MRPLKNRLRVPSEVKWTSISCVLCIVVCLCGVHKVLIEAELNMVGLSLDMFAPEPDTDDEDGKVVADARQEERRRGRRSRGWLADPTTFPALLLWLTLGTHFMRLHYWLFDAGAVGGTGKDGLSGLMNCSILRRSRPIELMETLHASLQSDSPAHQAVWKAMVLFFGPMAQWSSQLRRDSHVCVKLLIGHLFRRFEVGFSGWPWRMAALFDDELPEDGKQRLAESFYNAPECCLDDLFSLRLQKLLESADDLLRGPVHNFLFVIFTSAMSATANVESFFAGVRRWLQSVWRAPHISSIAQHHIAQQLLRVHEAWKLASRPDTGKPAGKLRDVWAKRKKRPGNAYNTYVSARVDELKSLNKPAPYESKDSFHRRMFLQASSDWTGASSNDQRLAKCSAWLDKASAAAAPDALEEYMEQLVANATLDPSSKPWGMADFDFPISHEVLDAAMERYAASGSKGSFTRAGFEKFHSAHSALIEADVDVPYGIQWKQTPQA